MKLFNLAFFLPILISLSALASNELHATTTPQQDLNIVEGCYKVVNSSQRVLGPFIHTNASPDFCQQSTVKWQTGRRGLMLVIGRNPIQVGDSNTVVTDDENCVDQKVTTTEPGNLKQVLTKNCPNKRPESSIDLTVKGQLIIIQEKDTEQSGAPICNLQLLYPGQCNETANQQPASSPVSQ